MKLTDITKMLGFMRAAHEQGEYKDVADIELMLYKGVLVAISCGTLEDCTPANAAREALKATEIGIAGEGIIADLLGWKPLQ